MGLIFGSGIFLGFVGSSSENVLGFWVLPLLAVKYPLGYVAYLTSLEERIKKCPYVHTLRQTLKGGDDLFQLIFVFLLF